jgi:hypothetical protein
MAIAPNTNDSKSNLLAKIAENTGETKPKVGDGEHNLLWKIAANTYSTAVNGGGGSGGIGATGATGETGQTGATGDTGPIGDTGATGEQGATGSDGATGASGIDGSTGATGSSGIDGATGATGEIGATGLGATGIDGASGATGATGASGFTTFYSETPPASPIEGMRWVNTLTMVEYQYYDNQWVEVTSVATGATGATGAGATGAVGSTGETGATGATGDFGATGATGAGATGETGATGEVGATGEFGETGATGIGIDGATGATGSTGEVGATGDIGATGATGATGIGDQGATGASGADGDGTAYYGQVSKITSGTITIATAGTYQSTGLTGTLDSESYGIGLGTTDTFAVKNTSGSAQLLKIYGSADIQTAASNETLGIKLALNGTPIDTTECNAPTGSGGASFAKLVTNWMLELQPNDEVALFVTNKSTSGNVTLQRARLVASTVGRQGEEGATGATGAVPANVVQNNQADTTPVNVIRALTQAEYDAVSPKDPNTIYFIKE